MAESVAAFANYPIEQFKDSEEKLWTAIRAHMDKDSLMVAIGSPAELGQLVIENARLSRELAAAIRRNHDFAHILIEQIGAPGPENIKETAQRAANRIKELEKILVDIGQRNLEKGLRGL